MEEQQQPEYDESGDRIIRTRELTAEEKLYMERAKQRHRQNLTKEQVVQGKVFKGPAFISKPDKILFRDFTVGKMHSLTISLTNVSNAFNSFNVLPLNERIRNFFEVDYTPAGKISPGLSCSITFRFTPIVNEDIHDFFSVLAETGHIDYPIECTSKKTIVGCQQPDINFGQVIYGEKGTTHIVIRNEGSLPSEFEFKGSDGQALVGRNAQPSESIKLLLEQLTLELSGSIGGNCQLKIPITITPKGVGKFELSLQLHFKNFKYSPPIVLTVRCECIEVPIYIEQPLYDLELCLPNHIYRRKLIFHNRSDNPMKVQVHQLPETKKFFEFNPVLGFIQNRSNIEVWVKVTVDSELPTYLEKHHAGQQVYEVEFKLIGADQVMPVPFRIRLKLTTSKLIVKPTILNFGDIDEGYSSRIVVTYENQSDLPQQLMFYPVPKNISFENDLAKFKVLPRETRTKYVQFRSEKLVGTRNRHEEGILHCKVITGGLETNEVKFSYSSNIRTPELLVESNKFDLPALQQGEIYNGAFEVKNNTGGKTLQFEVVSPYQEVCGMKFTPVVGSLRPGQAVQVMLDYQSQFRKLKPTTLKDLADKQQKKEQSPTKPAQLPPVEPPKKEGKKESKDTKKQTKLTKQQQEQLEAQQRLLQQQEKERQEKQQLEKELLEKNFDGEKALQELGGKLTEFPTSQFYQWTVPIYYRSAGSMGANEVTFLNISTTTTQKKLLLDREVVDFGEVAVGTRVVQELKLNNTTSTTEKLMRQQLPVFSGFTVINSLRPVQPGKTFTLVVQFQPTEELFFEERLRLLTERYSVSCILRGKGMRPEVKLDPQSGLLNMGSVLLDEQSQKSFRIKNLTNFQLKFKLNKRAEGIRNISSQSAFTCIPTEGLIQPNKDIQIKVRFKPDRLGQRFYELIHILVPEQKDQKRLYVWGNCYPRQAYLSYHKPEVLFTQEDLPKRVQQTYDPLKIKDEELIFSPANNKILVEFTKIDSSQPTPAERSLKRKLVLGSCKLLDPKLEKPTNFEVIMPKDDRFSCDNLKGTAAPGVQTIVTFTYKPPEVDPLIAKMEILSGVGQWKDVKAELKLSGGFIKPGVSDLATYELVLRAYINQL